MADEKKETWYEEQERVFLEKEKENFIRMFGPMNYLVPEQGKGLRHHLEEGGKSTPMDTNITMEEFNSFLDDISKPRKVKYGESKVTFIPNPQFDEPKTKKARTKKGDS
jgi:hypothetical protein